MGKERKREKERGKKEIEREKKRQRKEQEKKEMRGKDNRQGQYCGEHSMWVGCRQCAGVNIIAGKESLKYLFVGTHKNSGTLPTMLYSSFNCASLCG